MSAVDIGKLFDARGYLQPAVAEWMGTALGLDASTVRHTRFVKARTLRYHARTFYRTVWYLDPAAEGNATHGYSWRNWLNLLAHELYHRQEIGNNWLTAARFGASYGYHWVKNGVTGKHPYRDNPHEVRAFAMGCDVDSLVNRALAENPDILRRLEG